MSSKAFEILKIKYSVHPSLLTILLLGFNFLQSSNLTYVTKTSKLSLIEVASEVAIMV